MGRFRRAGLRIGVGGLSQLAKHQMLEMKKAASDIALLVCTIDKKLGCSKLEGTKQPKRVWINF